MNKTKSTPEDKIEFKDVNEFSDKKKTSKSSKLPEKEYAERNSLLTDLYENKHISTIYHMFLAILLSLFLNITIYEYLYKDEVKLGFDLLRKSFYNLHYVILVWIGMLLSTFIPYYGLVSWAIIRTKLPQKSMIKKIWDVSALILVVFYHILFLTVVPIMANYFELQIGGIFTLLCDAVRIGMKTWALVRSNAPRVLKYKPHVEDQILYPTMKQFLYFSFIPATVYQDNYPRTKSINWSKVFVSVAEFIGGAFLISCVLELYFVKAFEDYGLRQFELRELTMILVRNCLAGLLIFFGVFYTVLHIWMNLFGELLRFSDRIFYKDWWTSDNYERYYRTWNVVVHDWLYTYIYKDLYVLLPKNKLVPKLLVFFISAVFHEYILALSFGFFFPILFINFFVLSLPITFVKFKSKAFGNFFMWCTISLGMSINLCSYAMEYYCRANSPPQSVTWAYLLTPQLFNCIKTN